MPRPLSPRSRQGDDRASATTIDGSGKVQRPHPSPSIQAWRDLAALFNPAGQLADPLAAGRELDWLRLYRLAAAHLVAPQLYARLVAREALGALPAAVSEALAELHRLNAARNARLRRVLRDTARHLNDAGIEPLLLKGAIALLPDQSPLAAARMMSDLDLALYNAEPEAAEAVLWAAGYRNASNIPDGQGQTAHHHHLAPLFHPSRNGRNGYVELHRTLLTPRLSAAQVLPLAEVCAAAVPVDWEGLRLWVPSLEHRLLHNALHHQAQNDAYRSGRRDLRQLLEFSQLRALPQADAIDWPGQIAALDRLGLGEAVRGYLLAGERLFAQSLPPGILPGPASQWLERRFWFFLEHPRLGSLHGLVRHYGRRLGNLPRRLITPSWYPEKARYLRQTYLARGPVSEP